MNLEDVNMAVAKQTQIAVLKKRIDYEKQVQADRKWQFEQWDRNSAGLIAQYERELADLLKTESEAKS